MSKSHISNISTLPLVKDLIEKNYQQMIIQMLEKTLKHEIQNQTSYRDMMNDYTLWMHQIKTPIAIMHILLHSDNNSVNKDLQIELFKIEQYVEMALSILRLQGISQDLVFKSVALSKVIDEIARKYEPLITSKKNTLVTNLLDCKILTDEKWLTVALEQILSNAIKYTENGTITIYMDAFQENTLVIEDTGVGIAPEDLPRIFDKGYT